MIGDVKLKSCPICDENTDHLQGTFKCKEVNGELYHFDATFSDSLQKMVGRTSRKCLLKIFAV